MATKHTATFEAVDNYHNTYTLLEFTEYLNVGTMSDPSAVMPGLKELMTSDGYNVNCLGKGEYQVVQTGVRLHSK